MTENRIIPVFWVEIYATRSVERYRFRNIISIAQVSDWVESSASGGLEPLPSHRLSDPQ